MTQQDFAPGGPDVGALELAELIDALARFEAEPFHARQIFQWIYRRGMTDFRAMTDLSLRLRERLSQTCQLLDPAIESRQQALDGTEKFRLRLHDGREVESVFIPDTPRQALCLSTQVGCAMGCGFCLTGRMGLIRHLSAGEIVGQARVLARTLNLMGRPFNIVLMGMGEPLHNYDATMKAIRILTTSEGFNLAARRITLSTVGIPKALDRLATEPNMPNIAVSLHAANDALREALVPVARKYPLGDIIAACRRFSATRRRQITFEYVLLAGINDSEASASEVATLLSGLQCKVNLIPLNEAPGIPYRRPSRETIDRFGKTLATHGITVSVRRSRGRDIRAACGQLIVDTAPVVESPAQQLAARIPSSDRHHTKPHRHRQEG